MKIYATTRKEKDYYYAALVQGETVKVFPEPFTNRKTAFKHASFAAYHDYNYGMNGEKIRGVKC